MKFFNDDESKDYWQFLVINTENIPNECYSHFNKTNFFIWILDELIQELGIKFGNLSKENKDYNFVVNFEELKSAKFKTNNKSWMVIKTKKYLENTIEKIGFCDSDNYFYESIKKTKNYYKKDIQLERKIDWAKTGFFCLATIVFFFFVFLIFKLAVKKYKI